MQREIGQEEARRKEEEENILRLESKLYLRRAELFDYKFGRPGNRRRNTTQDRRVRSCWIGKELLYQHV